LGSFAPRGPLAFRRTRPSGDYQQIVVARAGIAQEAIPLFRPLCGGGVV